jgi:ribonuclease-3
MADLTVIFRTHSDIEASIVRGLLEAHGIPSLVSSDVPHSLFPLTVDGLGEVRIAVRADQAEEARRIIETHRAEVGGRVVPLGGELEALQERLGYRFRDRGWLEHALTHRSRVHEEPSGGLVDNESLEFLGDAILGFVVADMLFREFPTYDEGQKSKLKATLVSRATLARLGERLALGQHLLLGRGEEKTGGRRKQALLANTVEALIAAIYLDGGLEAAQAFVRRQLADLVEEIRRTGGVAGAADAKSALQEWLQSRNLPLPEYRLLAELGPDHAKRFVVEVWVHGEPVAQGEGRSKKDAEQRAAARALERLTGEWRQPPGSR